MGSSRIRGPPIRSPTHGMGGASDTACYNTRMNAIVTVNPKVMHGTPCFAGTRVAVQTLFDHLESGYTIDGFLEQFPTVQREQVVGLLEQSKRQAEATAMPITA